MDHKWGRDVFRLGLGDLGATLAASYFMDPRFYILNSVVEDFGRYCYLVGLPNLAQDYYTFGLVNITGRGNFPYGIPVPPDEPL